MSLIYNNVTYTRKLNSIVKKDTVKSVFLSHIIRDFLLRWSMSPASCASLQREASKEVSFYSKNICKHNCNYIKLQKPACDDSRCWQCFHLYRSNSRQGWLSDFCKSHPTCVSLSSLLMKPLAEIQPLRRKALCAHYATPKESLSEQTRPCT